MHCRRVRVLGDVRPIRILSRGVKQGCSPISDFFQLPPQLRHQPVVQDRLSPEVDHELKKITRVTKQLVDALDRNKFVPTRGWNHRRSLRGEEKRLEKAVRGSDTSLIPPTDGQVAWQAASADADQMYGLEEESQTSDIPKPGTYVEIRRGPSPTVGIVVGHALIDNMNHVLCLTLSGDMLTHTVGDIFFEIPAMVVHDVVLAAGINPLPTTRREVNARVEILKQLRMIEREAARAYAGIGSRNISVYPLVKSSNPDEPSTVTVTQAAKLIFGTKGFDSYDLLATHRYLMNSIAEFSPNFSAHRTVQTWTVQPQSHVDRLVAVTNMIHQSSPAIDSFVAKARSISVANKRRSLESWNEPPTQELASDIQYTAEDRMIIEVLHRSLEPRRQIRRDPYALVMTTILKKMEVAEAIDLDLVYRVLVELGHMAPWDDLVSRWSDFELDQAPDEKSAKVIAHAELLQKHSAKVATASSQIDPLGPEDLYLRDPAEHIRHDFGDLPVYVVDDIGAEELDDGLSIEPIPSEPGAAWIHVHVADPTAIIPPTHVFAQEARKTGLTAYFIHRTWPMLPKSLTLSKMSLGSNSKLGQPEPVLTFSFKIDSAGNMADYNVRAALIRNVITVDYDSVDHLLGFTKHFGASHPFDPPGYSPPRSYTRLDTEHVNSLHFFTEIAERHRQRNLLSSNQFYTSLPKASLSVAAKPLFATPRNCPVPYRFRGFPSLTYEVVAQQMQGSGSRMVVSECMKAACRVASRWASDRDIPMLRRSSKPPICLGDPDVIERLVAMRGADGYVDFREVQKSQLFIPPVEHTLEPAMHWSMGVPDGEGYIRVTSPLRRYNDLVAHWQIKHALLHPKKSPQFSSTWLAGYAPEIKTLEKKYKRAERRHLDFWSHLYIKRFLEDPHPLPDRYDPLQSLNGTLLRPLTAHSWLCQVHSLGVLGSLILPSGQAEPGDVLNIQIKSVNVGTVPGIQLVPRDK